MKLRLFTVDGKHFANKAKAKEYRRKINPVNNDGAEVIKHVINRGPDHRHGAS